MMQNYNFNSYKNVFASVLVSYSLTIKSFSFQGKPNETYLIFQFILDICLFLAVFTTTLEVEHLRSISFDSFLYQTTNVIEDWYFLLGDIEL